MTIDAGQYVVCRCNRGLQLNDENFYWNKKAGLYLRPCKQCISKRNKMRYPKVREKQISAILERYHNEPGFKRKVIERFNKWIKDNPDKFRQTSNKNQKRYIQELRNHYIARHYRKKYGDEPTPELIELVRMQLKLSRLMREA